jgi:hypothetical protein
MDQLTEGSPPLPAVFFADAVDRLAASPLAVAVLCCFVGYFAIFGAALDGLIVFAFLAWFKVDFLAHTWSHSNLTSYGSTAALIITSVIALSRVLNLVLSKPRFSHVGPARPLFIPARTTHRRIFPEKHSFSYSYLLTGVPVGSRGSANGLLSVDVFSSLPTWVSLFWSKKAWFDVSSDDYLQRGHDDGGLRGKLDKFLVSQVSIMPLKLIALYQIADFKRVGRGTVLVSSCLFGDGCEVPGLPLQSCLVLVPVLRGEGAVGYCAGSEQHIWRAARLLCESEFRRRGEAAFGIRQRQRYAKRRGGYCSPQKLMEQGLSCIAIQLTEGGLFSHGERSVRSQHGRV